MRGTFKTVTCPFIQTGSHIVISMGSGIDRVCGRPQLFFRAARRSLKTRAFLTCQP